MDRVCTACVWYVLSRCIHLLSVSFEETLIGLILAGILAAIFLRGVGIVGHPHPSREDDVVEEDPEKKTSVSSMKVE